LSYINEGVKASNDSDHNASFIHQASNRDKDSSGTNRNGEEDGSYTINTEGI
jgi:hypothetical protein